MRTTASLLAEDPGHPGWPLFRSVASPADHALALHKGGRGRVTIAQALPGERWSEHSVPVPDLDYALRHLVGARDLYITQNAFYGRRRRVANLAQLDTLFSDLDFYKLPELVGMNPGRVVDLALRALFRAGIPTANFGLSTGRGLALIWLHSPVPRQALPRWRLCQQRIHDVLLALGADPMATDAARVLRLVGTVNSKSGCFVKPLWPALPTYDFDYLADKILPFTRAEIAARRADRAARSAARTQHNGHPTLRSFSAATLWEGRLDELQRLLRHRWFGQLPPGHRDAWLFTAGTAVSYLAPPPVLRRELCQLARHVSPWSENETAQRLQAVIHRAQLAASGHRIDWHGAQHDPRYRIKDQTIIRALAITEHEMVDLGFKHLITPEMKRERARERVTDWRRDHGIVSRSEYLAESIEREKPWLAEGISRRTWYRRRVAQVCNVV